MNTEKHSLPLLSWSSWPMVIPSTREYSWLSKATRSISWLPYPIYAGILLIVKGNQEYSRVALKNSRTIRYRSLQPPIRSSHCYIAFHAYSVVIPNCAAVTCVCVHNWSVFDLLKTDQTYSFIYALLNLTRRDSTIIEPLPLLVEFLALV